MTVRVDVAPHMLEWARDRARLGDDELERSFNKYPEWLAGERQPTLKQLERFAKKTHAPLGYLLLDEPPDELLPVADFRKSAGTDQARPSPNLLDTIYACQIRQEWYRDDAQSLGEDRLAWVASLSLNTPVDEATALLRDQLGWDADAREQARSTQEAWVALRVSMEDLGVLVMISGHVGSSTRRTLDVDEFRGFVLVDDVAPLVFVNAADSKAAQVFTLVHELAHLWLGQSGLDDLDVIDVGSDRRSSTPNDVELWCNAVAAEVLVPSGELRARFSATDNLLDELGMLARNFRVSRLVVLGRLRECGFIDWTRYWQVRDEMRDAHLAAGPEAKSSGGNYYPGALVANSRRFTEAVLVATLEGRTLYRDAFRMLGVKSQKTFDGLAAQLGMA